MSGNGAAFRNLEIMIREETSNQPRLSPNRVRVYRWCLTDLRTQIDGRYHGSASASSKH